MDLKFLWARPQLPWRSSEKRPLVAVLEAHLIYQLSDKILQLVLLHRRPGQNRDQGLEELTFYKDQFFKKDSPILHCHLGTLHARPLSLSLFYGARHKHMLCQKEQRTVSTLLRPSTEWSLYFSCQFTQLTFRCYIPNLQKQKDKTTSKHMLLSFEWKRNKWNNMNTLLLPKKV